MSIVIRVEHLSKEYRLGVINHGMLYKDIQSWMARRLGRSDPHAEIGKDHFADQSDRFWALKDMNFEIQQGDRVGIIGKNGAGKSTLLKVLSRITAPTEGTVKIKGRVTSLLEVGTGFHGELTGRENIYLNGAILGMKKRDIDQKLEEIIDFSEIEQYIDTPVKRYSSGMYVRLAFAVAAHLESDILIADEVLAVGDAGFQKKALGKMRDLSSGEGRTVLFVSHNIGAVKALCNKGFLLDTGKLISTGGIDEIINDYLKQNIAQSASIESSYDRTGSGDVKFADFWIEGEDGERKKSVLSGESAVFAFKLKIEKPVSRLDLGFSVADIYGNNICILYSSYQGQYFSFSNTSITSEYVVVRLLIPIVPFNFSKLEVRGLLRSENKVIDWPKPPIGFIYTEKGDFFGIGNVNFQTDTAMLLKGTWIL